MNRRGLFGAIAGFVGVVVSGTRALAGRAATKVYTGKEAWKADPWDDGFESRFQMYVGPLLVVDKDGAVCEGAACTVLFHPMGDRIAAVLLGSHHGEDGFFGSLIGNPDRDAWYAKVKLLEDYIRNRSFDQCVHSSTNMCRSCKIDYTSAIGMYLRYLAKLTPEQKHYLTLYGGPVLSGF